MHDGHRAIKKKTYDTSAEFKVVWSGKPDLFWTQGINGSPASVDSDL